MQNFSPFSLLACLQRGRHKHLPPQQMGGWQWTDGLYKFNKGDNNKSIFISRDEIYKIISDKYIYAFIVYKYKIDLNAKKILYFPSTKNS